jgi:deferrochelatase/peroxidase EfeB
MVVTNNSKEALKKRAEARSKQQERALDGRNAMNEYQAQVLATHEKTAHLKELRLAQESQALAIREKAARLTALRLAKKAQAQSDEPAPKTKVRPIKKPQSITAL